ncbi:MAG: CAP domain-containing protein [Cyanobacteria bacterium P01_H01_bin.150]
MLKNYLQRVNFKKVFTPLGAAVLGTAMILAGMETTQLSNDSDILSDSSIVFGSKSVYAQSDLVAMEKSIYEEINQYRSRRGLAPLKLNSHLREIARQHSNKMASEGISIGHNYGISQRIPYSRKAENVTFNRGKHNPAKVAVENWTGSSRDHQDIVGKYELTGIGVAKNSRGEYYFTQIFINPR